MKNILFVLISLLYVFTFCPDASALGRNGKFRMRLKMLGDCDAYINNLKSGPDEVRSIPDGTSCRAEVKMWKRVKRKKGGIKRRRLVNKEIALNTFTEIFGEETKIGSAITNSKGIATIPFTWSDMACDYKAVFNQEKRNQVTESVIIYIDSFEEDVRCFGTPV